MPSAFRRAPAAAGGNKARDEQVDVVVSSSSTSNPSSSSSSSSRLHDQQHRRRRPVVVLQGVKPWQGGSYLTSFGLNDLDTILGGGQPLGTCIWIEEDRFTRDSALSLVKYWCAEAVSQEQHLIFPVLTTTTKSIESDPNIVVDPFVVDFDDDNFLVGDTEQQQQQQQTELKDLLLSLPKNLHWDKQEKTKKTEDEERRMQNGNNENEENDNEAKKDTVLGILEEEEDGEEDDNDDDEGLKIAWQYKKSVQEKRLATITTPTKSQDKVTKKKTAVDNTKTKATNDNVFCHSYDLSGRMIDQGKSRFDPLSLLVPLPPPPPSSSQQQQGLQLFRDLIKLIKDKIAADNDDGVRRAIRLFLYHPPNLLTLTIALPLLLAYIRKESLPVVILICSIPTVDIKAWIRLAKISDVVLCTEGFASRKEYPPPPEFRHLHGILKVHKMNTRKPTEIPALIYGFKRDRRKLHIQLLHIPPEDYADGGGSVGAGGVRSGGGRPPSHQSEAGGTVTRRRVGTSAGMGCSSNLAGSILDF